MLYTGHNRKDWFLWSMAPRNQYPTMHHAGWMVRGQKTLFHSIRTVVSYILTIHIHISTYPIPNKCLTYLPTYIVTICNFYLLTCLWCLPICPGSARWKQEDVQDRLPRWNFGNSVVVRLQFIHNWLITGFPWMVHWWVLSDMPGLTGYGSSNKDTLEPGSV